MKHKRVDNQDVAAVDTSNVVVQVEATARANCIRKDRYKGAVEPAAETKAREMAHIVRKLDSAGMKGLRGNPSHHVLEETKHWTAEVY